MLLIFSQVWVKPEQGKKNVQAVKRCDSWFNIIHREGFSLLPGYAYPMHGFGNIDC